MKKKHPVNNQKERKKHSSLAMRITSFYTGMLARWMSLSLVVIYLLVIGFNLYFAYLDTTPYINELAGYETLEELADSIGSTENIYAVLKDEGGNLIASSLPEQSTLTEYRFFTIDFTFTRYTIFTLPLYTTGRTYTCISIMILLFLRWNCW